MKKSARLGMILAVFIISEIMLIAFIDRPVSAFVRDIDIQHPAIIDFFRAFTDLGKSVWYLCLSGMGVLLCAGMLRWGTLTAKNQKIVRGLGEKLLFAFVGVAASGIATDILKPLIGRARPVIWRHEGFYGFHPLTFHAAWNSWPSGHATTAAALMMIGFILCPRYRALWVVAAFMLALSRVMVNAHFIADIVAGIFIGITIVRLWNRVLNHNGMFHVKNCIFPIDKKTRPP